MRRVVAILMLLVGLMIAYVSVQEIVQQDRMQSDWVEHPARVLTFAIPGYPASTAAEFSPRISYTYDVNGTAYTSTRLWASMQTVNRAEAKQLQSLFSPGKQIAVRVDPQRPSEAYVLPLYAGQPYWPFAGGVLFVAFGYGVAAGLVGSTEQRMRLLPTSADGWHELLPSQSQRETVSEAGFLTIAIGGPTLAASGWMLWFGKPLSSEAILFPITAAITATALLTWTARRWLRTRMVSDPRLHLRPVPIRRGQPIDLRVEIDDSRAIKSATIRARVACYRRYILYSARRTMMQTELRAEHTFTLAETTPVSAGQTMTGAAELRFDSEKWPATGREGVPMYPFFFWEIEIDFLADGRRMGTTFPVTAR